MHGKRCISAAHWLYVGADRCVGPHLKSRQASRQAARSPSYYLPAGKQQYYGVSNSSPDLTYLYLSALLLLGVLRSRTSVALIVPPVRVTLPQPQFDGT